MEAQRSVGCWGSAGPLLQWVGGLAGVVAGLWPNAVWLSGAALSFSRAPSHSRSLQPQGSPAGDAGLLVPGLPNTWVRTSRTSLPPHAVGQAGTSAAESQEQL